ncbi:MAG: hypothetical protein S0880_30035 [Actinomycetota bacterium]|nr:hypothetical protein [Actinomycetota bacterium]
MTTTGPSLTTARIALVGERSPAVRAHERIPGLLDALARRHRLHLDAYWIPTDVVGDGSAVARFDGVWLVPGSPYRSEVGAVEAARAAREHDIPFLGTCGGFQHALLDLARNVCGLTDARHAETDPDATNPFIVPLECSLAGHEATVHVRAGTLAERILGTDRTVERYLCSYGLADRHLDLLEAAGLVVGGTDDDGAVRLVELADHPFFVASLFQPSLAGDGSEPHPLIVAFAAAVVAHAGLAAVGG